MIASKLGDVLGFNHFCVSDKGNTYEGVSHSMCIKEVGVSVTDVRLMYQIPIQHPI